MTDEEKRRKELSDGVRKRVQERCKKAAEELGGELSEFVKFCDRPGWYFIGQEQPKPPALTIELKKHLAAGKKPSEFFKKKCAGLFDGYILPRYKEMFLSSVDGVTRLQYSDSYWRRSFRTADYIPYLGKLERMVCGFHDHLLFDRDFCDVLSLELPEDEQEYIASHSSCVYPEAVAFVLDNEPKKALPIIAAIINGESRLTLDHSIIRGIVMSRSAEAHEYLGKLLLAARLQEGLRQAICECADCGTPEAFLTLLKVIDDNDLIRFSSVKRAAGTWTGLLAVDSGDLERVSAKTLRLIRECVEDEKARAAYLKSEDSMEIYIALWAYGFYELRDAVKKHAELSAKGSRHQLLTAGYFTANIDDPDYSRAAANSVVMKHDEHDILAVYLPHCGSLLRLSPDGSGSRAEDEKLYERLKALLGTVKKKETFSPCVFPWYSAELERSDFIGTMCDIACALGDNEKIDECVSMIKDCNGDTRRAIMRLALKEPATDVQRAALVECLGDKDSYNRSEAVKLIADVPFGGDNYLQMEAMLRYKAADIRSTLINLLYKQEDGKLFGTASRLCADKTEEKRTAGLDIILRLSKDGGRKELFEKCRPLAEKLPDPSAKEKILIESITGAGARSDKPALFTEEDAYKPFVPDNDFTADCVKTFMEYFPDSEIGHMLYPKRFKKPSKPSEHKQALADIEALSRIVEAHRKDEFVNYDGEKSTMDCESWRFRVKLPDGRRGLPFMELWEQWYKDNKLTPARLFRDRVAFAAYYEHTEFSDAAGKYIDMLFGEGMSECDHPEHSYIMVSILDGLAAEHPIGGDFGKLVAAAELWFMRCVPDDAVMLHTKPRWSGGDEWYHLITHAQLRYVIKGTSGLLNDSPNAGDLFALDYSLFERCVSDKRLKPSRYGRQIVGEYGGTFSKPGTGDHIRLAYRGVLPLKTLYHFIFGADFGRFISMITDAAALCREEGRSVSQRGTQPWMSHYKMRRISGLLGHDISKDDPLSGDDRKLLAFVEQLYDTIVPIILEAELKRGDSPTEYSGSIKDVQRIYGMENFIAILSALGKETLERSSWSGTESKKGALSHLLSVCIPNEDDSAAKLKKMLKGTDITEKRLIEAAMYSPEWLGIVGDYLGWEGFSSACYYFMAHMNESFDDRRAAIIAKYTPLTPEELNTGAFDLEWFTQAYRTLGEKRFNMIYDAAKYISDGTKHSRARKYADAALGKLAPDETIKTVFDKRNKDLLMAYSLIPLDEKDPEGDLCGRYLSLTKFLKESKKFGAQRAASEKKAVEIAMKNLASRAGYADVTRLTLRMEAKLIDDNRGLFEDKTIDGVTVKLTVDENGKSDVLCEKGGKELKAIPAKLKKNEYIVRLTETKKALTEQYRRTRQMFEQAMEDEVEFTVDEINALRANPVALPIIRDLVFRSGKKLGFLDGNSLADYSGKKQKLKGTDTVVTAHPFALYKDGHWADYQKNLFDRQAVQPFKQVFRELYVKTAEEAEMTHSLRYAGNQIQPAKTVACLKTRRWVADVEDGLQKIYYKEDIVARIYALADWFSPADIEAPTLERVEFFDRKTGKAMRISEIPDIIFSEVMRDVDLAVSVAHAGGVDPETSHSTIEMRAALLEFTLPMFKLTNVEISGSHAHIKGSRGEYTLHLGSGVVHKKGGAMINILPVHSQQRGKLFLPFADDDPKTAEIMSKALLLAEDGKIKDPMILDQIKG